MDDATAARLVQPARSSHFRKQPEPSAYIEIVDAYKARQELPPLRADAALRVAPPRSTEFAQSA
jgi:hypothetical protein